MEKEKVIVGEYNEQYEFIEYEYWLDTVEYVRECLASGITPKRINEILNIPIKHIELFGKGVMIRYSDGKSKLIKLPSIEIPTVDKVEELDSIKREEPEVDSTELLFAPQEAKENLKKEKKEKGEKKVGFFKKLFAKEEVVEEPAPVHTHQFELFKKTNILTNNNGLKRLCVYKCECGEIKHMWAKEFVQSKTDVQLHCTDKDGNKTDNDIYIGGDAE